VRIAGSEVAAGRYALFAIPGKERWTIVLNAVGEQWGAYNHDPQKDVLRFDVRPQAVPLREYLTWTIDPTGAESVEVSLAWEKLRVAFALEIDVHAVVQQQIREALAKAGPEDWRLYYQAARYYHDNRLDLAQALEWINRSVEIQQSSWNLELLARLLHDTGDTVEAIPPLEKALELARASAPEEYVTGLERTLKEWRTP
jgi:tetratricopeptide (TPR) repeat protein